MLSFAEVLVNENQTHGCLGLNSCVLQCEPAAENCLEGEIHGVSSKGFDPNREIRES